MSRRLFSESLLLATMAVLFLAAIVAIASAAPNDNAIKNPEVTNCNANNPNDGGCPESGMPQGPVCGVGEHTGNPHCTSPVSSFSPSPSPSPSVTASPSPSTSPQPSSTVSPVPTPSPDPSPTPTGGCVDCVGPQGTPTRALGAPTVTATPPAAATPITVPGRPFTPAFTATPTPAPSGTASPTPRANTPAPSATSPSAPARSGDGGYK